MLKYEMPIECLGETKGGSPLVKISRDSLRSLFGVSCSLMILAQTAFADRLTCFKIVARQLKISSYRVTLNQARICDANFNIVLDKGTAGTVISVEDGAISNSGKLCAVYGHMPFPRIMVFESSSGKICLDRQVRELPPGGIIWVTDDTLMVDEIVDKRLSDGPFYMSIWKLNSRRSNSMELVSRSRQHILQPTVKIGIRLLAAIANDIEAMGYRLVPRTEWIDVFLEGVYGDVSSKGTAAFWADIKYNSYSKDAYPKYDASFKPDGLIVKQLNGSDTIKIPCNKPWIVRIVGDVLLIGQSTWDKQSDPSFMRERNRKVIIYDLNPLKKSGVLDADFIIIAPTS
ncbi:MAG: hypothetical protein ABJA67_08780 [Chthonomonadales bacterium]